MSGLYFHIPFCKQACHYCDFHFSTLQKNKSVLLKAMHKELNVRSTGWEVKKLQSIYFGGGTPSLLSASEIKSFIDAVRAYFELDVQPEITLEANPDDLSPSYIRELIDVGINRLSIGIQSFRPEDLKAMNRAHTSEEALKALELVSRYFDNYSVDLIYGIPTLSNDAWIENIKTALRFSPPHISAYALTVEEGTALHHFIAQHQYPAVEDTLALEHFTILTDLLSEQGYDHYEISNFGKPGYYAVNNTSYWRGKSYLGIGPAAHSYNGRERMWNVSNNPKYIRALEADELPLQTELLTERDRYNEAVMMGLRTKWGVDLKKIEQEFGDTYCDFLRLQAEQHLQNGFLKFTDNKLLTTSKGKFMADGLASDLFMLNLG